MTEREFSEKTKIAYIYSKTEKPNNKIRHNAAVKDMKREQMTES